MKIIFPFFLIVFFNFTYAKQIINFNTSKNFLRELYSHNLDQKEFYCGCDFYFLNKKGVIDFNNCGYQVRKNINRAKRVEWEHVMPAENFGRHLSCWKNGGRKNCKKDFLFNQIEGDMHNLQLSIGEVNGDRSNYNYAERTNEPFLYGKCESTVDFKNKRFYPRNEIKGIIARTYLYMESKYNIRLSKQNKQIMLIWNEKFAPNKWECYRNQILNKLQGNDNKFITEKCNN